MALPPNNICSHQRLFCTAECANFSLDIGDMSVLILLQGSGDSNAGMTEQRSASLQPLIGKAVANGGPPKATRLKPSRPPPPPPTAADPDGTAVSRLAHDLTQVFVHFWTDAVMLYCIGQPP